MHICNPSYSEGGGRRITSSRPAQAKLARPKTYNKRREAVAQEVACARPWVQSPLLFKKKMHEIHKLEFYQLSTCV
jgi:hypothetical protein